MTQVFVYGTLKKGFGNNVLLQNSNFIGEGFVEADMFNFGSFPVVSEGKGSVKGEVYEVNDSVFQSLDRLEGYPNFYDRKKVHVRSEAGDLSAWMYFMSKEKITKLPRVFEGVWK